MTRWQLIQAGIVTPGGDPSSVDAPAALAGSFALWSGASITVPFDRDLSLEAAAHRSCVSIHQAVNGTLAGGRLPLVLGGECSLVAGTMSAAIDQLPDLRLIFLDAHGDFNTAATSPSGYLSGMCLAHACGDWAEGLPWMGTRPFPGEQTYLIGGRQLDPGEGLNLARRGVRIVDHDEVVRLAQGAPVWVHIDLDILSPQEMFAVSHPVPGGMTFDELARLLASIADVSLVKGVAICGYQPAKDPNRVLPDRIAAAFARLLSSADAAPSGTT
jgi:arginase family enzyme